MENVLEAHVREGVGSRHCAQLRKEGNVPGVLYGRGIENKLFYVERTKLEDALRHQERLVQVKIGKDDLYCLTLLWSIMTS